MQVAWYVPVVLRIIVANGVAAWLIKALSKQSIARRNFLQFLFCFAYAFVFVLFTGQFTYSRQTALIALIALIGFFNSLGAYCQWQAISISLSKNSLFTFWDDVIAMTLAYLVLGEAQILSSGTLLGIVLSVSAVALLAWTGLQRKTEGRITPTFLAYVGTYSIIWGCAVFSMGYFGLKGFPMSTFLVYWYGGAVVGSLLILCFLVPRQNDSTPFVRDLFIMPVFSLTIIVALAMQYWAFTLALLMVVQAIFLDSEMIVPALIGLIAFGERKHFNTQEKLFFAMGILGGILIGVNF